MGKLQELSAHLRENILSILKGKYSHQQLNEVISLSHAFAIVFLKKKISAGRLNVQFFRLDVHDIAYDCIAELFRQDGDVPFIQLSSYFSGIDLITSSEQELVDALRRLVFSKVNHGVFRLFQEHDPSLSKILRNIKLAVQTLNNFKEVERFGNVYLIPSDINETFDLPFMEQTDIDIILHSHLTGNERIPEVLAAVSLALKKQNEFSKAVSLIGLGMSVRKRFAEYTPISEFPNSDSLDRQDASIVIGNSCRFIHNKMFHHYVGRRKITKEEYDAMMNVVKYYLIALAVEKDGQDFSLYGQLNNELKGISIDQYRTKYRAILEYLFSLTKEEISKEWEK